MADPYCLAMVLCDYVHQDVATGKCTILGTFGVVRPSKFPANVRFFVYAEVTDGQGQIKITLRIVNADLEDPKVVIQPEPVTIEMASPLAVCQLIFGIQTTIEAPGLYHCELLTNQNVLMSRRLLVVGRDKNA